MKRSIPLLTIESQIKRCLRRHLQTLGFEKDEEGLLVAPGDSKDAIRTVHAIQRRDKLLKESGFIARSWPLLRDCFADGDAVDPDRISPRLEVIRGGSWQSDLFRLAALTWSVPVSQGFGRRIRFIVWDGSNDKLVGLIALGDPVFNLKARDDAIGWTASDRSHRLACVLDAYVLGAVPPYNSLLAGKLLACLIRSSNVRAVFRKRYRNSCGIISGECRRPQLALVTTTSALGRSAVYNRLVLEGTRFFQSVGFTGGWGHFHVPDDLFDLMRHYLSAKEDPYARNNRFGDGPNWRFRAIRRVLALLGQNRDLLRHNIRREVFMCSLGENSAQFLRGEHKRLRPSPLQSVEQISAIARARWIIPRAHRVPAFRTWKRDNILEVLRPRATCVLRADASRDVG